MTSKQKRRKVFQDAQPTTPQNTVADSVALFGKRTGITVKAGYISIVCQIVFVLFCFYMFAWVSSDMLRIIGEYAFFQDSWSYFYERNGTVGGPLCYLSDFLTSLFLFPFIGTFVLVILLLLIQMTCARLFRFEGALVPLSFLPSFLLCSALLKTGYLIFSDLHVTLLLGNVLGVLFALWFAFGYQRIASPILRCLYCVTGVYVLYYCTGIFGMLALMLCLFLEIGFPNTNRRTLRIVFMLSAGILAPLLFHRFMMSDVPFSRIFFVSVPSLFNNTFHHYHFYFPLFALLIFEIIHLVRFGEFRADPKTAVPSMQFTRKVPLRSMLLACLLYAAMILEITAFASPRGNVAVLFRMWTLMEQGRWQEIVDMPNNDTRPIRPIVLFRNLALFKTGRLGNEAFSFPQAAAKSDGKMGSRYVCGPRLLYEYGSVNTAYRISMHHLINRNKNYYDIKMLARCSLVNGEPALAHKYLQILHRSPFHRHWAETHLHYLDELESERMEFDDRTWSLAEEIEHIRKLMPKNNFIIRMREGLPLDGTMSERIYAEDFNSLSDDVRELILFHLLLDKQLITFEKHFDFWFHEREFWDIPVHFQEAILVAAKNPNVAMEDYRISPSVCGRYQQYVDYVRQYTTIHHKDLPEYWQRYERQFGDTYWFYHDAVRERHFY